MQHAYDALTPMVELDRQRRAEATEGRAEQASQSVTEAAQRAGHTPTEAAQAQHAYDALTPMVELDRQRRAEATDGDSTATLGDPWGDAASKLDGGSFEDRSPEELDPGFTPRDDGNSPNPADMDRGFTPTPRTQMTFDDDEGETITAGSSDSGMSDSGFSDSGSRTRILGFRVLGLRVLGLRFLGLRVLGLRVLGFRVLGLRVLGLRFLGLGFLGLRILRLRLLGLRVLGIRVLGIRVRRVGRRRRLLQRVTPQTRHQPDSYRHPDAEAATGGLGKSDSREVGSGGQRIVAEVDVADVKALHEVFAAGSRAFVLNPPTDGTKPDGTVRSCPTGCSWPGLGRAVSR